MLKVRIKTRKVEIKIQSNYSGFLLTVGKPVYKFTAQGLKVKEKLQRK